MAETKKRAKAPGRKTIILEIPEELLGRVDKYTDDVAKADAYRPRSRNAALLVLIDAGLEAVPPVGVSEGASAKKVAKAR